MTNKEISSQFSVLAKLMDIHGENPNKAKSYTNAAFALSKLPFEIEEVGIEALEGQYGIGKGVINGVLDIMDEGELPALEELKAKTPNGILALLSIRGIGPKKIGQLWKELEIDNPGSLLQACKENRLTALKGFGAKTQTTFEEKLEHYFANRGNMLWSQAEDTMEFIWLLMDNLMGGLNSEKIKFELLGDYYWQNETVGSFDIIINAADFCETQKEHFDQEWFFQEANENIHTYKFKDVLTFNFICVAPEKYEREKFIYSFSKEIQEQLELSKIPVSQDELIEADDFEVRAFKELGLDFMAPYLRNNPKAFEKAKTKLPSIIQPEDIKGVIHNHTKWSDGINTIEEMANACIEKGYEYFVLSDHSKTSFYANGLSEERIFAQQKEIDELNRKLKPFRIFKSIECDILGDGRLDYSDEVLATFDLVICSIHQNLNMTEEKAMSRLINAIENPYTSILCHPTGRLLISRKGYPIDHKKIIDACAANDVVLEINANPRRLDMDWRWIDYAMEKDVVLSINPDAHRREGIDDIRFGVLVAQKGMLTAAMNLSSFSLSEFEDFLRKQHEKRM